MNLCLHARRAQSAWAYKVRNAWCRATRPWSLDSDVPLEDFLSQPLATQALLHRLPAKRSTFATIEVLRLLRFGRIRWSLGVSRESCLTLS